MPASLQSSSPAIPSKARGAMAHRIGDVWQWLGISGDRTGANGIRGRTLFYGWAVGTVLAATLNTMNVLSELHGLPGINPIEPVIWEGSSWLSLTLLLWVPWIGYRMAPPNVRPRWRLLVHPPLALAFSLAHVAGFILLRVIAYQLAGSVYKFGPLASLFLYEFRKDVLGYCLFIAGFWLIEHLLRQKQQQPPGPSLTFDIRDGAKLTRVRVETILAVASAGNYVEFVLADGRRLLMRSPLSVIEKDLADHGFVRTHRSWLINAARVTALTPEGSGDYAVALPGLSVPLSRRYKAALNLLRGA
jgi:DNA-binding LytR/AlgR family response regulator